MSYKTSRQADRDIIDIYGHGVAVFGVDQAERYHEGMVSVFELRAENPYLARERRGVRPAGTAASLSGAHDRLRRPRRWNSDYPCSPRAASLGAISAMKVS
jgi:plasmid stabilization system protein ParE